MKLGLSLSGGGARGISHVGVLKALDEEGIKVDMITGASAGAIAGAFYCYGYAPDEIFKIITSVKLYRYVRPALNRSGLLKMDPVEPVYRKFLPEDDFSVLKIPLVISATNLRRGTTEYFNSGKLIPALMASTSVPVIFNPVNINGEHYVDGGILNNLPIEPMIGFADRIIGVNCNPVSENYEVGNMRSLLERSLLMAINVNSYTKKSICDLFLEPPGLKMFGGLDFKKAGEMFDIGYQYAKSKMSEIKNILK